MIPKECKRLAEVDFPIAEVSRHAAREKSIRHGHPSTLHLWWARRPLASSRAVLLSLLWPDPCDPVCPEAFKTRARQILQPLQGKVGPEDEDLRAALIKFIGQASSWDLAGNLAYLEASRSLVSAAHPDEVPLVVDPFAGGGSIPLEALRVGADAFASDLNPVACLILRTLLENTPRRGRALADELRAIGARIKEELRAEVGELFQPDPDGRQPIAYLWARTVRCESPSCGAEIPLFRSPWLAKGGVSKARFFKEDPLGRSWALLVEAARPGRTPTFRVARGRGSEHARAAFIRLTGTVSRAKATCLVCRSVLAPDRVRRQLSEQRGGADPVVDEAGQRVGGATLLAVAAVSPDGKARHYRTAADRDYRLVGRAQERLHALASHDSRADGAEPDPIPNERLPLMSGTFNVPLYGMHEWGDLFTSRQKLVLATVTRLVGQLDGQVSEDVRETMALAVGRAADKNASLCSWNNITQNVEHVFGRSALGMIWDFAEGSVVGGSSADWDSTSDYLYRCVESTAAAVSRPAQVQLADAVQCPLPDDSAGIWFTDPPYYFAVPYADLSDFFYVWLKRALRGHSLVRDPFDPLNPLTPKDRELCEMAHWDRVRYPHKDKTFFEGGIARAFAEGRRVLRDDGIGAVVFAHKTTEGWEALLSGLIQAGWTITASWPIATERPGRLRSQQSAALATSVHLICRPRPQNAPVGDWAEVLHELPSRVARWMNRLQEEGVRGADLVFACIGPALEIFSRYVRVETADGEPVTLADYLEKVWEVVGRSALHQVLGTGEHGVGAFEEDARLTALFLWTLQSTNGRTTEVGSAADRGDSGDEGPEEELEDQERAEEEDTRPAKPKGYTLVHDVVRRFAQPLGIHLDTWEDRVIETRKGVVRLLPLEERGLALLGVSAAQTLATRPTPAPAPQLSLFAPDADDPAPLSVSTVGSGRRPAAGRRDLTTLDRVHLAMLLQRGGQAAALRNLLAAEQDRGPEFLRLANALSALYPRESEEKRLLDAMLLAVPK